MKGAPVPPEVSGEWGAEGPISGVEGPRRGRRLGEPSSTWEWCFPGVAAWGSPPAALPPARLSVCVQSVVSCLSAHLLPHSFSMLCYKDKWNLTHS